LINHQVTAAYLANCPTTKLPGGEPGHNNHSFKEAVRGPVMWRLTRAKKLQLTNLFSRRFDSIDLVSGFNQHFINTRF